MSSASTSTAGQIAARIERITSVTIGWIASASDTRRPASPGPSPARIPGSLPEIRAAPRADRRTRAAQRAARRLREFARSGTTLAL